MNEVHTLAELEQVVANLSVVLQRLNAKDTGIVSRMRDEGMLEIETPLKNVINKHIPGLLDWSSKLIGRAEDQLHAFKQGKADAAAKPGNKKKS